MIKEPMFISPRTFRGYEQYKTDCARASGWNEAMAFIFAEELEIERTRTIREKFFIVETDRDEPQTEDEKVRDVVRGFIDLVNGMRNPTEEEMESVNKHIESISKPTGVNIFDEIDEPQTDCPWKQPDGRD